MLLDDECKSMIWCWKYFVLPFTVMSKQFYTMVYFAYYLASKMMPQQRYLTTLDAFHDKIAFKSFYGKV